MGLQDTDGMRVRDQRDAPFTPPPSTVLSGWTIATVLVVVVLALFKGYAWLLEPKATSPLAQQSSPVPQAVSPPEPVYTPPASAPAPEPQPGPTRQWVRCTVNGQTLYSDTECPGTTTARYVTPEPQPVAPASRVTTTTLYHCKAYNGSTFWARSHCNQHQALVDRMVNVPSRLPFDQQVHLAEASRRAATNSTPVQHPVVGNAAAPQSNQDVCKELDKQIARWDAMARQPQTAPTQDWIREQRKQARDRQFVLRC